MYPDALQETFLDVLASSPQPQTVPAGCVHTRGEETGGDEDILDWPLSPPQPRNWGVLYV